MYKKYKSMQDLTMRSVLSAAPCFSGSAMLNGARSWLSMEAYCGKYVLILFYPSNFVQSAAKEMLAFNEVLPQLDKLHCALIAITPDSVESHMAWYRAPLESNGLNGAIRFPLVADKNLSICRSFGVLRENKGNALRSLFVVDPNRKIRFVMSMDLCVRCSVQEILSCVQDLIAEDERQSNLSG
ncbi:hypothetical protein EG68_04784 [Paragonimus skrjabini miyazakii]|uniref:thioredoxin-dependent peroxiredoxin n=1 Tax=Paragonimus skrjabini miyazakii TaxID=59628 RepID=A0A8S9YU61_9TREM|nr:hypothetical protein EG68_04784 [Paragonimus skrjabini miyazakii]